MSESGVNNFENPVRPVEFQNSNGKLIFLCGLGVFLCSVTPFVPFAPAPLALAFLIFGNSKASLATGLFTLLLFGLAAFTSLTSVHGVFYIGSAIVAWIVQKIIRSKENPHQGLFKYGFGIIALGALLYGTAVVVTDFSLEGELVKAINVMTEQLKADENYKTLIAQGGEQGRAVQDLIDKPEAAAKEVAAWLPSGFFISVFFTIWITMFMVFRNSIAWRNIVSYQYNFNDFLEFKVPYFFIYPVIVGLALAAGGDYILGTSWAQPVGYNIIYCLGIFYLFQGVGVLVDFLKFAKIHGFFRNLMVIFAILMLWRALAIIGLFDVWINFRKFFRNKNEGDLS